MILNCMSPKAHENVIFGEKTTYEEEKHGYSVFVMATGD